VGKHPIPNRHPSHPQITTLRLGDIADVHPAVLKVLNRLPSEPVVELRGVSDKAVEDVFKVPRIAVVPIRGETRYWVWGGVRAYLRLRSRGWRGLVTVLDYGPRISEEKIACLAETDWVYASPFSGQTRKTDWAYAQVWEAHSDYICKPTKSGKRRVSGRNLFATVSGLNRRRLRADK
jgi:hypothetical protein